MRVLKVLRTNISVICIVLSLIISMNPVAILAADTTLPEEFYGDLTINIAEAPAGAEIIAKIGDEERGSLITTEDGEYGGTETFDERLVVSGLENEVGDEITFWVDGNLADQTAIFEPGESQQLDLAVEIFPLETDSAQISAALEFLAESQESDGGIGGYLTSSWAVIALAAVGEDLDDWTNGSNSIVDYLEENASANLDADAPTDWERSILSIVAAERNPRSFGGLDHVETLLNFYDGTQMGDETLLNDDIWGIPALAAIGEDPEIISKLADFIIDNQNGDGGWSWVVGGDSDADNTAAAISALIESGISPDSQAITDGLEYLKSQQQNNGGFVSEGSTNSAVDSWVIRALHDAGQDPAGPDWRVGENNPVGHLLSLQDTDGAFKWTSSARSNPQWMTAYAVMALSGSDYPEDTTAPNISGLSPSSGACTTRTKITISAEYMDSISGIDIDTVELQLDNSDVTGSSEVSENSISYTASGLSKGTHTVMLEVSDKVGNQASQTWSFRITSSSGGGGGSSSSSSSTTTATPTPTPAPAPSAIPGVNDISTMMDSSGTFLQSVFLSSEDQRWKLNIDAGIKALTSDSMPLNQITMTRMDEYPLPPEQGNIIGAVYDFGPTGASFEPYITLSYTYDLSEIPVGVSEDNLVIALWDSAAGKWVELPCVVDSETKTIKTQIHHFCLFALIVNTSPADLVLTNLTLLPSEIKSGEEIIIRITVTNHGDISGETEIVLKVDGIADRTKLVSLEGGEQKTLDFSIIAGSPGDHTISIGEHSLSFTVNPPPVLNPPPVTEGVLEMTPEEVKSQSSMNTGLLVAVILLGLAVIVLIVLLVLRTKRSQ